MIARCLVLLALPACCVTVPLSLATDYARHQRCPADYDLDTVAWTSFDVAPTRTTPKGLRIDDSEAPVDLALADALLDELAACLGAPIERCAIVVKSTRALPCADGWHCAGIVQPPNVAVVLPDLGALKHEAIHLIRRTVKHDDPAFRCE